MKTSSTQFGSPSRLNLLLVGNNPIEMGSIIEKLHEVQLPDNKIVIEIAFDLKSISERLAKFKPSFIIIDDNISKAELSDIVTSLSQSRKTKDIPITVLKNSNYEESHVAASVVDYVLKQNFNATSLMNTFKNSLKFKRTRLYLHQAYIKRKPLLVSK